MLSDLLLMLLIEGTHVQDKLKDTLTHMQKLAYVRMHTKYQHTHKRARSSSIHRNTWYRTRIARLIAGLMISFSRMHLDLCVQVTTKISMLKTGMAQGGG